MPKGEKLNLKVEEIRKRQEELHKLGIFDKFTDFTVNKSYLNEFLENYSELSGQNSYIVGSILFPLFKRLREKYPNLSQEEEIKKASELAPIIRTMLEYQGVFKLIKKVSQMKDSQIKKETEGIKSEV